MTAPQLPDPLVPPEVDLRDFGFMPLDVVRLRDSDIATVATGDEFKAAVLLWCTAWHQIPASSIPKDDRWLARHSGAGARWKKVKAEALRGFVECNDGRLYHPVVAEKAAEGWNAKRKEEWKRACDRTRKANKDRAKDDQLPMPPEPTPLTARVIAEITFWRAWNSDGTCTGFSGGISSGGGGNSGGNPDDGVWKSQLKGSEGKLREGTGKGQGQGKDQTQTGGDSTVSSGVPPSRAAAIAVKLREWEKDRGKVTRIHSAEPRVQEWAKAGLTDEQLREAYDLAVADRAANGDDGPINAGFLHVFVQKLLNPKAAKGAPLQTREWHETHAGVLAKCREVGYEPKPDDDPRWLKCVVAVRIGGDHWPWIDPKNVTQQGWIADLRANGEGAAA